MSGCRKALLIGLVSVVLLSVSAAFDGTNSPGTSGGGDDVSAINLYCKFLGENCGGDGSLDITTKCNDGKDNNGRWGKDYSKETWNGDNTFVNSTGHGDPGCASPIDNSESLAWDTDLTATMLDLQGTSPQNYRDPTVYFDGKIKVGNDMKGTADKDALTKTFNDVSKRSELRERHLKSSNQGLGEAEYSATGLGSDVKKNSLSGNYVDNLAKGSVVTGSGRVIDPPVDPDDVSGSVKVTDSAVTCGDGKYKLADLNSDYFSQENPEDDASKPTEIISGLTYKSEIDLGCESDYGVIMRQPHHMTNIDDSEGDLGEYTESDQLTRFSTTYTKTHNGDELTATNDEEDAKCVEEDKKTGECEEAKCEQSGPNAPESITTNSYWSVGGDRMTRHKVERTDSTDTESDTGKECGDKYKWREQETVNCNSYNQIHGGGRQTYREEIAGIDKPSNDRAGTYTDFTASGDDDFDAAWCHYDAEKTLTVDADGPKGGGDGFVVIKDGEKILGTKSPGQSGDQGMVGQKVYAATAKDRDDGQGLTNTGRNFLQAKKSSLNLLNCPNTAQGESANYCIKYVDFYTSEQGRWGGVTKNPSVSDAVKAKVTHKITPDESYSACKFINKVSGEEVMECDFEAGKNGGGDMSPLTQTCGDQSSEELILAEGNQLDFPVLSKELYQSQSCVDVGKDLDSTNVKDPETGEVRKVSKNGCVLGGVPYAEGSVVNMSVYGSGVERSPSPDYEVCLNAEISESDRQKWDNSNNQGRRDQQSDYGGEWYDLDNENVQQYVKNNFNAYDYSSEIQRIETYMVNNTNPRHPDYNPEGETDNSIALEDDCGLSRSFAGYNINLICEGSSSKSASGNLFYSFFDLGLN